MNLFSSAALTVLNKQVFNSHAKGQFEYLSGGVIWADEFPSIGAAEWDIVSQDYVYRFLIGYRASITLGKERGEFREVWGQVVQFAQNWPGLRPERRGPLAKKRLLAAKRVQARCFDECEKTLDAWDREHKKEIGS